MPFGSFFKKAFKKTASDVAAQYGGENARGLVEQGIDQIPFGDDDPNNPAGGGGRGGGGGGPGLGGLGGDDLVSGLLGAFSGQQQNGLTALFGALGGDATSVEQRASEKGLDPALINGVISMLTSGGGAAGSAGGAAGGGGGFDLGALLKTVASLTKGGGGGSGGAGGSIDGFLSLLSGGGGADGGVANSSNIIQILIGLAKSFFAMQMGKNKSLQDWGDAGARSNADDGNFNSWAMHLIKDLIFPGKKEKDVIDSNPDDKPTGGKGKIKGWFDNHPEIGKMQKDIFDDIFDTTGDDKKPAAPGPDDPAPLIPQPKDFEPECSVLDNASILFLNTNVLLELRKEWRFLFSTKSHARDFGDFVSRVELQGPSVLVVQDGDGNVFGAFASTSWADTNGAWTGNGDSFVFSIKPKMAVFHATGKDDNIMFLSRDSELGLGGRKGRFGLSLASSLEAGTYHEDVDTFDLPPIFAEEFSVAHVEVWGLGPATNPSAERSKLQLRRQNMDITNKRPVDLDDLEGQIG